MQACVGREAEFRPVTLTITMESQEEVDQVFALFNNSVATAALPLVEKAKLWNTLRYYRSSHLTANDLHSRMCESFRKFARTSRS